MYLLGEVNTLIIFHVQPWFAQPVDDTFHNLFKFYIMSDQYTASVRKIGLELEQFFGSSHLDIYRKGADNLMGRYFLYHMYPLSIGEIVRKRMPVEEISLPP